MKAFITGATGFVGSHLTDILLEKGFEVYCLKRNTSSLRWLENKNINFVNGDLFSNDTLEEVIKDMDYVFHVAGLVKAKNYDGYNRGNYLATKNLLEICSKVNTNLKKFVYISSLAACGPNPDSKPLTEEYNPRPITAYGKTKLMSEKEVLKYKETFPVVILRPPAIYGPRDTEILIYFKTFANGLNSIIGFKDKYLSIIHVKDFVKGIYLTAEKDFSSGEVFFISSDTAYNWTEIGKVTKSIIKKRAITIRIPHWIVYSVGAFSQFLSVFSKNAATLNIEKCKDITQKNWVCSNEKAKSILGFTADFDLESGFEDTFNWYKKMGWIK